MAYTKVGPFTDYIGSPGLSAAWANGVESALTDAGTAVIVAPAPTGNATTDTANLQAAITAANSTYADLILAPAAGGSVKNYLVNTALTWNLNRGSIYGRGLVGIDFSAVSVSYTGPAFSISTNTTTVDGSHQSATHRIQGIRLYGHNTDTSTMDGIAVVEGFTMFGNDQGIVESCIIQGFRDNITFGSNVWSFDFRKCAIAFAHRYNINAAGGTGECQQFTECNVYGANNATSGGAANLYMPAGQTIDLRFYGGSFDYPGGGGGQLGVGGSGGTGGIQGIIRGGCVTFHAVHIEDSNTVPMFTYDNNTVGTVIDVTFRDCFWSSTGNASRDHIHEILASTRDNIIIRFEGDKGSVTGVSAGKWLVDNSGLSTAAVTVTYRGFGVVNNGGVTPATGLQLGNAFGNLLTNGGFDTSTAFVAANGLGWTAGGTGTWTIQATSARSGNALQVVGTGAAGTVSTSQRVRLSGSRRPLRVLAFQQVTAYTGGTVGTYVRFLAEDGTTAIGSDNRLVSDESAVTGWKGKQRILNPPAGASFAMLLCVYGSFSGTAQWDDIEIVEL